MSATAYPVRVRARLRLADVPRPPFLVALVVSRLLVFAAGSAGARTVPWRSAWQSFDPTLLTLHLGAVGNVVAGAAVRWDSVHLLQIATHGYTAPSSAAFYPLYPLLTHVLGLGLGVGANAIAGVAISVLSFGVALGLLGALTERELGRPAARAAIPLLAFAPLSFFFSAVYTESLFLALSLGAFYALRTDRWRLAVALSALAALTRVTGVLLVIPLFMVAWPASPRPWKRIASLAAVPGALLGYLVYDALRGWGLSAAFSAQAAYGRVSAGPLGSVILAVQAAGRGVRLLVSGTESVYMPSVLGPLSIGAESLMLLGVLALAVAVLRLTWRRLPRAYGVFAAASLFVCLSSPGTGQPLYAFDRFCLTIFPLWMAAAAWLAERERTRVAVCCLSAGLLAFFTFQFGTWAFIA